MIVKTDEDLQKLQKIGGIVAVTLQTMIKSVEAGMTTKELDTIGAKLLESYGATSAPMGVYNFPGYNCISINGEIAHGIPGERKILPGDMVNIDVSASLDGYFGDNGATVLLPPQDKVGKKLLKASREALANSIRVAVAGRYLNRIGKATEDTADKYGFYTIRNLCGHGIGKTLHDEPEMINNYYDPRDKRILEKGMVLAIETFISERENRVYQDKDDGWTLRTPRNTRAAQFEHTIIVTEGKPIILTVVPQNKL